MIVRTLAEAQPPVDVFFAKKGIPRDLEFPRNHLAIPWPLARRTRQPSGKQRGCLQSGWDPRGARAEMVRGSFIIATLVYRMLYWTHVCILYIYNSPLNFHSRNGCLVHGLNRNAIVFNF